MTNPSSGPTGSLWARFRFSVVGPLLSAPPERGALKRSIEELAEKTWTHPVDGRAVRFAAVTIERWYYTAKSSPQDPVGALRRAVRKDAGKVSLAPAVAEFLVAQYRDHSFWSYQLHYDNLVAAVRRDASLGSARSYSTVRRFMQSRGLVRKPRPRRRRPGEARARARLEAREQRSFEAAHVGGLWHLDFHHGSLRVLLPGGEWIRPIVLGILDDHSRLCCHVQWYLTETAEDLVHGLCQAFQKRGLPRALMTDNGSAMVAEETERGFERLGIQHDTTLPYCPEQNGKQESIWATLEGRLMAMVEGVPNLTLEFLNQATQAWSEMEYNRAYHSEIKAAPLERFTKASDVLRPSPSSDALRQAFRLEARRRQRRTDGTISLARTRFEVPSAYRHFRDVTVHYARWDLSHVHMVDERTGKLLAPIYPLDRQRNADGYRKPVVPSDAGLSNDSSASRPSKALPPLLEQLLDEYAASGLPPAYLPKPPCPKKGK